MAPEQKQPRPRRYTSLVVGLLLAAGLVLGLVGCAEKETTAHNQPTTVRKPSTEAPVRVDEGVEDTMPSWDRFSTFESKDPFIQQVVPGTVGPSPTGPTPPVDNTGTTLYPTTLYPTTYYTTTTRWSTTTTRWITTTTRLPGTTTTKPATTTTTKPPYAHTLKVLSVEEVGGVAVCTFKVDNTVYTNKRVGDVVSSSWGQIQVVAITLSSKVVTLLQGSETLVLTQGQQIFG